MALRTPSKYLSYLLISESSILFLFSVATEHSQEIDNFYFPEGHKHVIDFIFHSSCISPFLKMKRNWRVKVSKTFVHDEHDRAATGFLFYYY